MEEGIEEVCEDFRMERGDGRSGKNLGCPGEKNGETTIDVLMRYMRFAVRGKSLQLGYTLRVNVRAVDLRDYNR